MLHDFLPAHRERDTGTGCDVANESVCFLSEPRVSCISDILMAGSSLTCKLVGGRSDSEDDEDEEADVIDGMTVW